MISRLLLLLLGAITLPASMVLLWGLWKIAAFFEAELIHMKRMAMDDSMKFNILERLEIKSVWIPFGVVGVAVFLFHAYLVKSFFGQPRQSD